ncbi:glycolipid transfer protein [Ceratobasidium sp. AG-Ba]|nr:glycolipid transfer protein [Ceratobasidium sp. AG-Ba]QRV94710.1 glycolipid transfer protein [Ceratobasidium sp. AG-Ba]QRW09018.1 glycolipid transfer protein [Ceratobasidium sp. AG-Ba]
MPTYFDEVKKSFVDVPVTEEGVATTEFLEASEGLVGVFVQSDMRGNIAKVRARQTAHPTESTTLEKLVENEWKEKKRPATEGLMWLLRGLAFTCIALQKAQANKSDELTQTFSTSYEATLKPHHNFVVKGAFALAMKACPYRKDFYEKLGSPPEKVNEQLDKWLAALHEIVTRMQAFYEKGGYNKGF